MCTYLSMVFWSFAEISGAGSGLLSDDVPAFRTVTVSLVAILRNTIKVIIRAAQGLLIPVFESSRRTILCACASAWLPSKPHLPGYIKRALHNNYILSLGYPFLFKNYDFLTLSCAFAHTVNETLKWLTQLPTLMQNHSGDDSATIE